MNTGKEPHRLKLSVLASAPGPCRCLWLALALCGMPAVTQAALNLDPATAVSQVAGDDNNTSTLYGPIQPLLGKINAADAVFNASAFSGANWNYTWATAAQDALVLKDITVTTYNAWVVNQPTYTDPAGTVWGGRFNNAEAGGGELVLNFNPKGLDPLKGKTVDWIQNVYSSYYGGVLNPHLDAPATATSPFYNTFSAAGQTYFADIPGAPEREYENNPVANVRFTVFLATDNVVGGVNNVTIYGGEYWGYQYTATDLAPVPETATAVVGFLAAILTFALVRPSTRGAIRLAGSNRT